MTVAAPLLPIEAAPAEQTPSRAAVQAEGQEEVQPPVGSKPDQLDGAMAASDSASAADDSMQPTDTRAGSDADKGTAGIAVAVVPADAGVAGQTAPEVAGSQVPLMAAVAATPAPEPPVKRQVIEQHRDELQEEAPAAEPAVSLSATTEVGAAGGAGAGFR